jgi:hypothetical protein
MRTKLLCSFCLVFLCLGTVSAQKTRPKPPTAPKTVIFAVLNDGKLVEPIAYVQNKKLEQVESAGETGDLKAFGSRYYSPKSVYTLIFGGAPDGTVAVGKSNIGSECGGNSADVVSKPATAKLYDLVMGLGTNAKLDSRPGFRRRPTAGERSEIETFVRARFQKEGVSEEVLKNLRYQNLTALDLDHNGKPEFVGSYWVAPKADERRLLFFVAEEGKAGKYFFSLEDYSAVTPKDVMSGDVKDLDAGVGHELLLDVLDIDNDGVDEIFTIGKAFEGNNYHVYKREGGKWNRVFETYNYRCAY